MDSFEYDVFLSFARADEPLVRPVWEHLSASGLRVFWSDASLQERLGDSWFEAIERSLERSRHFLLVCTPASMASEWVQREYRAFHSHCFRPGHRRLIPLLAQGFAPARLPLFMRELEGHALDGADSLRIVARMLGGADLEAHRARLAILQKENATLRATVDRLNGEVERLRASVKDPPAPAPAPAPDDSVLKVVRGWMDELKVEVPSLSDNNSTVKDHNSRDVFEILQWALPWTGENEVVAALRSLLRDPDQVVRWKAMRLLTYYRFGDAAALRELWSREEHGAILDLVLECLGFLSKADALELAIDIARRERLLRVRRKAVKVLPAYASQSTRGRVTGALMEMLTNNDKEVRCNALQALTRLKAAEPITVASRMALEDLREVRVAALELLSEVAPIESFGLVIAALPGGSGTADSRSLTSLVKRFTKRFGQDAMLAYVASITDSRRSAIEAEIRKAGGGKL